MKDEDILKALKKSTNSARGSDGISFKTYVTNPIEAGIYRKLKLIGKARKIKLLPTKLHTQRQQKKNSHLTTCGL